MFVVELVGDVVDVIDVEVLRVGDGVGCGVFDERVGDVVDVEGLEVSARVGDGVGCAVFGGLGAAVGDGVGAAVDVAAQLGHRFDEQQPAGHDVKQLLSTDDSYDPCPWHVLGE